MSTHIRWQRFGLAMIDALLSALSLYAAYWIRFNFDIPVKDYHQYLLAVPVFVVVRLLLFGVCDLYKGILKYASTSELAAIFISVTLGTLVIAALNVLLIPFVPALKSLPEHNGHLQRIPWNVVIIEFLLTLLVIGGARFSRRVMLWAASRPADAGDLRRVLIVGAGDAGEAVARQMRQSPIRTYLPVAFADDDPHKQHSRIHGIPVAGSLDDLPALIARYNVQEVLIAIPKIDPERLGDLLSHCDHARVGFKTLPSIGDVFAGKVSINHIRPVEIDDLLGREEVKLELPPDRNYVKDQVVMVTGAGGSIGSELCRQLLTFDPKQIVVFGHGENSIYEIQMELSAAGVAHKICPVIGDIRDVQKLRSIVERFRPTIFFHAAAHKHVPLMEQHPDEAIKNNVRGTLNVAQAANDFEAHKFILISSDKAVRPTSIMGASKRIAEMIVFCMAKTSRTQFVAVRFGNVLGSRGSVIPLFKSQIARGGPITLTHPEVTRFFMTIPEAVSLVIQAGSAREQRRLFLLHMGKPVKIVDLARNLIQLSGLEPDKDIEIRFVGMRPGEKLKEELLTAAENVKATDMGKIFVTEPDDVDCDLLWRNVSELEELAADNDNTGIRARLKELIPDYLGT